MQADWQVHSHHININSGDCAVHLLVQPQRRNNNDIYDVKSAVLIDGGYGEGARHITSFVKWVQSPSAPYISFQYFNAVVITHWDGDHKGGLVSYFGDLLKKELRDYIKTHRIANIEKLEEDIENGTFQLSMAKSDDPNDGMNPTRSGTMWYAPYWDPGLRGVSPTCRPHKTWSKKPRSSRHGQICLYITVEGIKLARGKDTPVYTLSVPMGQVVCHNENDSTDKGPLAYDFFSGYRIFTNPDDATSPGAVCKKLYELQNGRPAIFCIAADKLICGGKPIFDRYHQYRWDPNDIANLRLVKGGPVRNADGVKNNEDSGTYSIGGRTTENNQASIVCMICWPDFNEPRVTHYLGGDAGDFLEELVLCWAVRPHPLQRDCFLPIRVPTIKLSHHGARYSTPLPMLPAWNPDSIICPNGMHAGHNHVSWPTVMLVCAWSLWSAHTRVNTQNKNPHRLWCLNYPVYLTERWEENNRRLSPVMNPGSMAPLDVKNKAGAGWRDLVAFFWSQFKNKSASDGYEMLQKLKGESAWLLILELALAWNDFTGILDGEYTAGVEPISSGNYAEQIIRLVAVVQSSDQAVNRVQYKNGFVIKGKKGAWDAMAEMDDCGLGKWEEINLKVEGVVKERELESVVLANPPRCPRAQNKAINDRTTSPWIRPRRYRRPLAPRLVSKAVGDGLRRATWGKEPPSESANALTTEALPSYQSPDLQSSHDSSEETLWYLMSSTAKVQGSSPLNKVMPKVDSYLDLLLERLNTGAFVLSERPTSEPKAIALDDSDELLHFFRDIFSPITDETCTMRVTMESQGMNMVQTHGFEATLDLADLLAVGPGKGILHTRGDRVLLTFRSAHNSTGFPFEDEKSGHPSWVTGGKAEDPDFVGPGQIILMSLDPKTPAIGYNLDEIARLIGLDDSGMSKFFSLDTEFQLVNDPGSRNALWFFPLSRHTTTLRLVFKPAEEGSLNRFRQEVLATVKRYTGLKELDMSAPRIVAKRTWTQIASDQLDSRSELAFISDIRLDGLKLECTLAIQKDDVRVVVSFGENNCGLTTGELLVFVAKAFTGGNSVPVSEFFPNAILQNVRLLRVFYQMSGISMLVGLDFQINWAKLVLRVTVTYDIKAGQFGLYGTLFTENRPSKLTESFNYLTYMPGWEPWSVLRRTSTGDAQAQPVEGIGNLNDIYQELTKTSTQAEGDALNPGPFEMDILQLYWTLEDSVVTIGAVVVCPARERGKTYRLPLMELTAGSLDLRFDYKGEGNKIRRLAVVATFVFRMPPKEQSIAPPKVLSNLEKEHVAKVAHAQMKEAEDDEDEHETFNCTVAVKYVNQAWSLEAEVTGLSGAMLFSIFDDDCKHEVAQLLGNVRLDLDIEYRYDNNGEGNSFSITGALYIGSLELTCAYIHNGDGKWQFTADVALGDQQASLASLAAGLFGIDPKTLPSWVGGIKAESNALSITEATSLASLELVSLTDRVVLIFRFKLTDGSTVAFYQIQEKKIKKDQAQRRKPKRVLMLSAEGLPEIPSIPLVGTVKQPFDHLDFLWVLDGNENSQGITRNDVAALNDAIEKSKHSNLFPRLRFKDTIKKSKDKKNTNTEDGDREKDNAKGHDVLIAPGFHFVVSGKDKVMLDHAFGGSKNQKAVALDGVYAEGTSTTPINKKFGPVTLLALGLGFDMKSKMLSLALDGSLELGPLGFTLIGLEVSFHFGEGITLRKLGQIKPTVSLSGLGASFKREPILLEGLFEHGKTPDGGVYYQGAASIGFSPYVFRAAGYYGESSEDAKQDEDHQCAVHARTLSLDDFGFVLLSKERFQAFLVYCSLDGPLMTIGYAEVRGLTGGVGYNTSITMPTVDSVMDFPFLSPAKAKDTEGTQNRLMQSGWFGVRQGSSWVAAGVTVLAFQMLAVSAVVVVESNPSIKLGLFGVATAEMPRQSEFKFARVQLALAATVDFDAGVLRVDGQLTPASFVLDPHCHLTGGFALYAWFGKGDPAMQGSWVFTIGGYHPRFVAPTQFPVPPRLGISWSFDESISITGEAYFAITPKVCMGGGRLHVTLSLGPLYAYFDADADFLIQYRPFHFETEGGLAIGVRFTLDLWLVSISIAVDIAATLYLEGPPMRGTVHVDFWVFGFDVNFGTKQLVRKNALSLDDFYDLVLQAEAKQPAAAMMPDHHVPEQENVPAAAHILSCASGIIADNTKSSPTEDDPWRVRGAIFAFAVSCKFVFESYEVITVTENQETHTYTPTPPSPGKGRIYARPMGLRDPIHKSKVAITITRLPSQLLTEDEVESSTPIWNEVTHSAASLPTALWGKVDSSDPLDGTTDAVVELPSALSLQAPGAKRSKDAIAEFSIAESMGMIACERDFPPSCPMDSRWDPEPPLTPPRSQYEHVSQIWEEKKKVGAEFAELWSKLPAFGWVDDDTQPVLNGTYPDRLVRSLESEYTEAPRTTSISELCF